MTVWSLQRDGDRKLLDFFRSELSRHISKDPDIRRNQEEASIKVLHCRLVVLDDFLGSYPLSPRLLTGSQLFLPVHVLLTFLAILVVRDGFNEKYDKLWLLAEVRGGGEVRKDFKGSTCYLSRWGRIGRGGSAKSSSVLKNKA